MASGPPDPAPWRDAKPLPRSGGLAARAARHKGFAGSGATRIELRSLPGRTGRRRLPQAIRRDTAGGSGSDDAEVAPPEAIRLGAWRLLNRGPEPEAPTRGWAEITHRPLRRRATAAANGDKRAANGRILPAASSDDGRVQRSKAEGRSAAVPAPPPQAGFVAARGAAPAPPQQAGIASVHGAVPAPPRHPGTTVRRGIAAAASARRAGTREVSPAVVATPSRHGFPAAATATGERFPAARSVPVATSPVGSVVRRMPLVSAARAARTATAPGTTIPPGSAAAARVTAAGSVAPPAGARRPAAEAAQAAERPISNAERFARPATSSRKVVSPAADEDAKPVRRASAPAGAAAPAPSAGTPAPHPHRGVPVPQTPEAAPDMRRRARRTSLQAGTIPRDTDPTPRAIAPQASGPGTAAVLARHWAQRAVSAGRDPGTPRRGAGGAVTPAGARGGHEAPRAAMRSTGVAPAPTAIPGLLGPLAAAAAQAAIARDAGAPPAPARRAVAGKNRGTTNRGTTASDGGERVRRSSSAATGETRRSAATTAPSSSMPPAVEARRSAVPPAAKPAAGSGSGQAQRASDPKRTTGSVGRDKSAGTTGSGKPAPAGPGTPTSAGSVKATGSAGSGGAASTGSGRSAPSTGSGKPTSAGPGQASGSSGSDRAGGSAGPGGAAPTTPETTASAGGEQPFAAPPPGTVGRRGALTAGPGALARAMAAASAAPPGTVRRSTVEVPGLRSTAVPVRQLPAAVQVRRRQAELASAEVAARRQVAPHRARTRVSPAGRGAISSAPAGLAHPAAGGAPAAAPTAGTGPAGALARHGAADPRTAGTASRPAAAEVRRRASTQSSAVAASAPGTPLPAARVVARAGMADAVSVRLANAVIPADQAPEPGRIAPGRSPTRQASEPDRFPAASGTAAVPAGPAGAAVHRDIAAHLVRRPGGVPGSLRPGARATVAPPAGTPVPAAPRATPGTAQGHRDPAVPTAARNGKPRDGRRTVLRKVTRLEHLAAAAAPTARSRSRALPQRGAAGAGETSPTAGTLPSVERVERSAARHLPRHPPATTPLTVAGIGRHLVAGTIGNPSAPAAPSPTVELAGPSGSRARRAVPASPPAPAMAVPAVPGTLAAASLAGASAVRRLSESHAASPRRGMAAPSHPVRRRLVPARPAPGMPGAAGRLPGEGGRDRPGRPTRPAPATLQPVGRHTRTDVPPAVPGGPLVPAAVAAAGRDPSPQGAGGRSVLRSSAASIATLTAAVPVKGPVAANLAPPPPASAQLADRRASQVQRAAVRPAGTVRSGRGSSTKKATDGGAPAEVQRVKIAGHRGRRPATPAVVPDTAPSTSQTVPAPATPAPKAAPAQTSAQRETEFDRLVAMLEDRILAQLERRGGRYHGLY